MQLQAVLTFKVALERVVMPQHRAFVYQCIAAMPDDPRAVWVAILAGLGIRIPASTVATLCALYCEAVVAKLAAVAVPTYDLAAMESVGGVQ